MDNIEDILDEFDFGRKTIDEIKSHINNTYKLRGYAGFIDKYISFEFEELDEEFYIDLEDVFEELEENQQELGELEYIQVVNILHISKDETKIFKNSRVHINSYINCEGHLSFDSCEIYYNENDYANGISLAEGASIDIINSRIICNGINESTFIHGERENSVVMKSCELNNCNYFIKLNSDSELLFDNCIINNPNINFLNGYVENGIISNCQINFTEKNHEDEKGNFSDFFGIFREKIFGLTGRVKVKECIISGSEQFSSDLNKLKLFDIDGAIYENCSFININSCIDNAEEVSKCNFYKCKDVVTLKSDYYNSNVSAKLTDCLFEECERVVEADKGSHILNCQFVRCKNRIIGVGYDGGVTIEFCEFYNITYDKDITLSEDACLYFKRTKGKQSTCSTVKKCIFDGINVGDGFLIFGDVFEKVSGSTVYLQDCSFRNCVTKRESGKIIKDYDHYYGLFNKKVEIKTVSISGCNGLDKINKENGYNEDVIIKAETSEGIKIGATVNSSINEF